MYSAPGTERTGVFPRRGGQIVSIAPRHVIIPAQRKPLFAYTADRLRDKVPGPSGDAVKNVYADELVLLTNEVRSGLDAYDMDMAVGTASLNGLGEVITLTESEKRWLDDDPVMMQRYRRAMSMHMLESSLRPVGVSNFDYHFPGGGNSVISVQRGGVHNIINNGSRTINLFQPVRWRLPEPDIDPANPDIEKPASLEARKFEHANREVNIQGRRVPIIESMTMKESIANTCRDLFRLPVGSPARGTNFDSPSDWPTKKAVDDIKILLTAIMLTATTAASIKDGNDATAMLRAFAELQKSANSLLNLEEAQRTVLDEFKRLRGTDAIGPELTANVTRYMTTDLMGALLNSVTELAFADRRKIVGIARSAASPGTSLEIELSTA